MTKGEVSVVGLGVMGAALARALIRGGYKVTVWNRTSAKTEAIAREGAIAVPSVAAAVRASPVIIACVADYEATRTALGSGDAASALSGRVLVQLSTGTPQDAREGEQWARELGAEYLDGAIMATPSQVGRPDTTMFLSGPETSFRRAEPPLRAIAGKLTYLGEPIAAAAAWDLGVLSSLFGALFGFLHGARVFESEGIPVGALGSAVAGIAPAMAEMIQHTGDVIQTGHYDRPESTVRTCAFGFELFFKQAREAGITEEFPHYVLGLAKRAIAAGYGDEEFGAVIKVLRERAAVR